MKIFDNVTEIVRDDMEKILQATPQDRQTVFFSATLSKPIRELIERHSQSPKSVHIRQKELTVPTVEQWYYETPQRMKFESLLRLLDFHRGTQIQHHPLNFRVMRNVR